MCKIALKNPQSFSLKIAKKLVSTMLLRRLRSSLPKRNCSYSLNARASLSYASAKPFNDIPKPLNLPLIGNGYYLINKEYRTQILKLYMKLIDDLGPLYNINIFGVKFLVVADPVDAKTIIENEGEYPTFPSFTNVMGKQR